MYYCYLFRAGFIEHGKPIFLLKVGITNDLERRYNELENSYQKILVTDSWSTRAREFQTEEAARRYEQYLHYKYKDIRIQDMPQEFDGYTEWFQDNIHLRREFELL